MGAARNAVLGLGVLAYVTVVGGVILQNLPVSALIDDPPVVSVALATGILISYVVVVGVLFGEE